VLRYDTDDLKSEHATKFTRHHIVTPERVRVSHQWQPNTAKFDGITTSQTYYVPHSPPAASSVPVVSSKRPVTAFEASSVYASTFKKHDDAGAASAASAATERARRHLQSSDVLATTQMAPVQPTYRESFRAWPLSEAASFPSAPPPSRPLVPFEAISTAQDHYRTPSLSTRGRAGPPPVTHQAWFPNTLPFETETTSSRFFRAWPIDAKSVSVEEKRPSRLPVKFEATTTNQAYFTPIPPHATVAAIVRSPFVLSKHMDENRDFLTEARAKFRPLPLPSTRCCCSPCCCCSPATNSCPTATE